jgi:hypothetical protein
MATPESPPNPRWLIHPLLKLYLSQTTIRNMTNFRYHTHKVFFEKFQVHYTYYTGRGCHKKFLV